MKAKISSFALFIALSIAALPALAQFYWQDDGVSIRQGTHLGWNGSAITVGDDIALFYYHAQRDGTRDVWGQRIRPDGSYRWNSNGVLISGNISEQRAPVAKAYDDGSILVVWEDYVDTRYRDLVAQRYDVNGNPMWNPAQGITVVSAPKDQYDVKLAIDEDGYAYVTFSDQRLTNGVDVIVGAYAQVLSPNGTIMGPMDGIPLVDEYEFYNVPCDIVCHNQAAYILCVMFSGTGQSVVLQKLLQNGAVAWPEDSTLFTTTDYGETHMAKVPGGLAVTWCDRTDDIHGDARLVLMDYDRTVFPNWSEIGVLVAGGPETQSVHRIDVSPNNELLLSVIRTDENSDRFLSLSRYDLNGNAVGSENPFGLVALEISPVDICWDGSDAIVTWAGRDEFYNHSARTQKLSPLNVSLWAEGGNEILYREDKSLRVDIEKSAGHPARLLLLLGRSIAQPESLFIGTLAENGTLTEPLDFFSGGLTYDIFDPKITRIGSNSFGIVWSDSRASTERDIYFQIVNGEGQSQLEPQGRKLSDGNLAMQFPPAICADGNNGIYVAWTGDSLGIVSLLKIQRIANDGSTVWNQPARIASANGFHGDLHLVEDGNGGVFVAYSRFSTGFVTRPFVARVNAGGEFAWTPESVEFNGEAGTDLTISSVAQDGDGGLLLACESGQWTNQNITVFHINSNGVPGTGWTLNGQTFGTPNQERSPALARLTDGVLLTYASEQGTLSVHHIYGALLASNGVHIWDETPKQLTPNDAAVTNYKLSADGTGGFLLAWEDYRSELYVQPYAARFDENGNPLWPNVEKLVCDNDLEITGVALTQDGSGGAWLTWEDYRDSDEYPEIDLYATHLDGATGEPVTANGFEWPSDGYPVCDVPTYQRNAIVMPWINGSALAVWIDLRSSNPGRCCGAGSVGDLFQNIYGQVLSEFSLASDETQPVIPQNFGINSIYPNPFNPETKIEFTLAQNTIVELSVYNVLGQKTATLLSKPLTAGVHDVSWNATDYPSGIYFAKLQSADKISVKKMVVMK